MVAGAQGGADPGGSEAASWIPVLPFAAALWLLIAHRLPLRFAYHPNREGIVSVATLRAYPVQQETAWYLLSLAGSGLLALLLATAFAWIGARRVARPPGRAWPAAGVEVAGAAAIACLLALPTAAAAAGVAACLGAAIVLHAQGGAEAVAPPLPDAPLAAPRAGGLAACLLLATLLTPPFWAAVLEVAAGTPDAQLVRDNWPFHAELGQHLAWADVLRRGGLQGRDFFSLYGPLFPGSLAATWAVLGRSLAAAHLWDAGQHVLGLALVLAVASLLVRQRVLVLLVPFLVVFASLRIALPLVTLALLLRWHARGGLAAPIVAGALTGIALLYSQEFGLAALLAAGLCFALLRAGRASAAWGASVVITLALGLAPWAWQGALGALLHDLVSFPRWVMAGFGKLPFPSPLAELPLVPGELRTEPALVLRLGLGTAAVCAAAILVVLPRGALAAGRIGTAWRVLAARLAARPTCFATFWLGVFGVIAFRASLGRSDLTHVAMPTPVVALVLVLAADRTLAAARAGRLAWVRAATRLAALALFAWAAGYTTLASPLAFVGGGLREARARLRGEMPAADASVWQVAERIRALTEPGDAIFVLPNSGAYYYLTERRNPTRFVLPHQMITNGHRAEALRALRRDPPRLVVWDDAGGRVDGIDDARILGARLLRWLHAHYELAERIGNVQLLRPRDAPRGRPAPP